MTNVVYFVQRKDNAIKIGTTFDFRSRLYSLEHEYGKLRVLGIQTGSVNEEERLHYRFRYHHKVGEWFEPDPELFDYIEAHTHLNIPPRQIRNITCKPRTITALTKIAGLLQRETGRKVSTDRAAWEAIQKAFPDIAQEVVEEFGELIEEDDEDIETTSS